MRAYTEVVGGETGPEAFYALLGHRLLSAVHDAGVRQFAIGASLLLLHLGLNVVEGKRANSGGDGGNHGATELDLPGSSGWAHGCRGDVLGSLIRHEHAHVEGGGSKHGGSSASPQFGDTLLGNDAGEGIEDVLVVAALGLRKSRVSLHPDEGQIAGVSNEGTEGASEEGGASALEGTQVLTVVLVYLNPLSEVKVDTETESAIDDLPEKGRVKTVVEPLHATCTVDLFGDVDGRGAATALRAELNAHLHHIDGLNAAGSSAGGEGSDEEVEVEIKVAHCCCCCGGVW